MKKSNKKDNKKDIQRQIFEDIRKELPSRFELARTISKILKVSTDSVYRRIRGEKDLSIGELITLCQYYNLSVDRYLTDTPGTTAFFYPPLRLSNPDNHVTYTQSLARFLKSMLNVREKELLMALSDISIFHFLPYKELTLFKSFMSINKLYEYKSFSTYIDRTENIRILDVAPELVKAYAVTPTSEIWTEGTIEPTLRALRLYYIAGCFDSVQVPLLICEQLIQIFDQMEEWTNKGYKSTDPATSSIQVFLNEQDFETDFFILRSGPIKLSSLKLSTFNNVTTSDPVFCNETERFMEECVKDSILLNDEIYTKERVRFFNKMRHKIRYTANQIERLSVEGDIANKDLID